MALNSAPSPCSSVGSSGPGGPQRAGRERRGREQGAEEEEPPEEEGRLPEPSAPQQTRRDGADPGGGGAPAREDVTGLGYKMGNM